MASLLIVPITGSVWWFVTAYIYMMLVAPSYNAFLDKFNRKGMLMWSMFLLVFGQVFGNLGSNFHDFEKAVFFYTLGVFFRNYINVGGDKKSLFLIVSLIGIMINGFCQYEIAIHMVNESSNAMLFRKIFSMVDYLLAEPLSCIGMFGLFSCFKFYNRKVNWIARKTFGIYLLHEAPPMRLLIWLHILKPYEYINDGAFVYAYIVFCVVFVFVMGIIVDAIRERLFENFSNKFIEKFIGKLKIIILE